MHTYVPPLIENERSTQPDEDAVKAERPFAETLGKITDLLADGLALLASVPSAPQRLVREGEKLEEEISRAPDDEPPRGLWQSVRNWVQSVIQSMQTKGSDRSPNPDLERRVTALEQGLKDLAEEIRAGFERLENAIGDVRKELGDTRNEVGDVRKELGDTRNEVGDVRKELGDTRNEVGDTRNEVGDVRKELNDTRNEVGDVRNELNDTRNELLRENKETRDKLEQSTRAIHARMDGIVSDINSAAAEIGRRFDMLEESTAPDRAKVVEDSLQNWATSHQAWRAVLPPEWEQAQIQIETLWTDRVPSRYWKPLCDDLGLPRNSSIQGCDLLVEVAIQHPAAPVAFLLVGEASVNMDRERIQKVVRHAREIAAHTQYQAVPCLCAARYAQALVDMARASGVMALRWQRGAQAQVLALPDSVRAFLRGARRES